MHWRRHEKAGAEVEVTARAIRQIPSVKPLVEMCSRAVGWQRLLYRTKLLSVSGEEEEDMPATEEGIPAEDGVIIIPIKQNTSITI